MHGQRTSNGDIFNLGGISPEFLGHHLELFNKTFDCLDAIIHLLHAVRRDLNAVIQWVQLSVAARQVTTETQTAAC